MKYGTQTDGNKYLGITLAVATMICTVGTMVYFCMMNVPK